MSCYSTCKYAISYQTFVAAVDKMEEHFKLNYKLVNKALGCNISELLFTNDTQHLVGVPTREATQRFNMMAGPHWETILKAWEIVNDR